MTIIRIDWGVAASFLTAMLSFIALGTFLYKRVINILRKSLVSTRTIEAQTKTSDGHNLHKLMKECIDQSIQIQNDIVALRSELRDIGRIILVNRETSRASETRADKTIRRSLD